jgi:cytochrome oxidase assembly protein ShyY1
VKGWRFALTRRWAGYLVVTLVFAGVCIGLSKWQVDRTAEARAGNALIDRNFHSTPQPIDDVLPTLTSYSAKQEWTQVTLTGHYLADDQLLVRNRSFNGTPGFEVLNPLELPNGKVFVVNRGFLPTGEHNVPDVIPQPKSGTVTVIVRLKQGEPNLQGRTPTKGQLPTVRLPDVAKVVGKPTYTGAYGLMVSESPSAATRPAAFAEPTLDEGLHISYAIQWVLFIVMAFFGLGYAIRQEYRLRNADDPEEQERAEERARRKAERPRSDSDIEDELLDRAGAD